MTAQTVLSFMCLLHYTIRLFAEINYTSFLVCVFMYVVLNITEMIETSLLALCGDSAAKCVSHYVKGDAFESVDY
jgi:hypothetical protein